jgi:pilus assembly protein CpaB
MILRIGLFVLLAVGLVGFGTVAWFSTRPAHPPVAAEQAAPPPAKVMVLVAGRPLRAGTFLRGEDLRAQEIVVAQMPPGASADTPGTRAQLQGAMVRHSIGEGQAVLAENVLRSGDHGFLAAVLEPGMRAMTFSLNDVASDWALIWPGDRVDLILTAAFEEPATFPRRRVAAETVASDLRVVAVDRQLMQGEMADDAERKTVRTLTIEASPADSERLAIAMRLGKLSIALRSAARPPEADASGGTVATDAAQSRAVTWSGDVAHALREQTRPPEPVVVRVFPGSDDGKEFKF